MLDHNSLLGRSLIGQSPSPTADSMNSYKSAGQMAQVRLLQRPHHLAWLPSSPQEQTPVAPFVPWLCSDAS